MAGPSGLLLIWTDVTEAGEADFNAWYDRQHLAERVAVPGFLNGRRYAAIDGAPKYLAWYETESPAVLASAAYGARQARPTAWTQQVMPTFRNVSRITAERIAKAGDGVGGFATTLRLRPAAGREAALEAALAEAPPALLERAGVVKALAWRPSAGDAAAGTTEAKLRAAHEAPTAWGLLIEGGDPEIGKAGADAIAGALAEAAGAAAEIGTYRLMLARGAI